MNIIGEVEGRFCILIDDIVDSAGTLCNAAAALKEEGADEVIAYCTHGVLSGGAVARVDHSAMKELVITDTIAAYKSADASPQDPYPHHRALARRGDQADRRGGLGLEVCSIDPGGSRRAVRGTGRNRGLGLEPVRLRSSAMPTVLVTGANRGLGLEFVRQYAAEGWHVIAACRDPGAAAELQDVPGDVEIEPLDVADWSALAGFAGGIEEPLDVLICNAGVYGGEPGTEGWLDTFAVNCIAPTLLARALVDHMAPDGRVVAITSKMGSIADNSSGGAIVYRSSKAALNAAWRSLAIDWKGRVTVAMLHPGWVRTDMGGPHAMIDATESVAGMRRVIAALTPERSGAFLDYQEETVPW